MGQSQSSHSPWPSGSTHRQSTTLTSSSSSTRLDNLVEDATGPIDYTSFIPDDLLATIFQHLDSDDRKRCSLVSRRWLLVEGQSRYHLTLNAQAELFPYLCPMFARFVSVMTLTLRCSHNSLSINDYGLMTISAHCPRLMLLKLRGCNNITELGMANVAKYCMQLKKFSCGACILGVQAINALLNDCTSLEALSFSRLRLHNFNETTLELIGPGAADSSLKYIHLNDVYNGFFFQPLIAGSKKLQSLRLIRCSGEWDSILESVTVADNNIMEVHLERVHVSDIGLSALSNCRRLQMLHIAKAPYCTNAGVSAVAAGRCRYLRKVLIDGWKTGTIGDDGLMAVGRHLVHLKELILIGVNVTTDSLREIGVNCRKLERLALCGCEVSDRELLCIAFHCDSLKMICIRCCPVNDLGVQAFAYGCPNLVSVSVKDCKYVSGGIGDWLRARRGSLEVALDDEPETVNATTSEREAQEEPVEVPAIVNHGLEFDVQPEPVEVSDTVNHGVENAQPEALAPSSSRGSIFKKRFGVISRRGFAACAFGRRSGGSNSSSAGS